MDIYFLKRYYEAKKIIESMIEEKEDLDDENEKIVWDNFILTIINTKIDYDIRKNKKNLEDKYF